MTDESRITRRRMIGSLAILILSADAIWTAGSRGDAPEDLATRLKKNSRNLIPASEFEPFRRSFIRDFPNTRDLSDLLKRLSLGSKANIESAMTALMTAIQEDFLSDRTWVYDGWLLSKVEAELLFHLCFA